MSEDIRIVRDTDPRCVELEASGYSLVAESWGARLRLEPGQDLDTYLTAVNLALGKGIDLQELNIEFADALLSLELANNSDYPYTPATARAIPTNESIRTLWRPENLLFGAFLDGVLVGAISTSGRGDFVELDFASILRDHRGKGIGKALASAAILEWVKQGTYLFGTGGASVNEASLGTVRSLGFSVEERWRSYQPPL